MSYQRPNVPDGSHSPHYSEAQTGVSSDKNTATPSANGYYNQPMCDYTGQSSSRGANGQSYNAGPEVPNVPPPSYEDSVGNNR